LCEEPNYVTVIVDQLIYNFMRTGITVGIDSLIYHRNKQHTQRLVFMVPCIM